MQELAEKLRHEDRENGRGRRWRGSYTKLNAQLVALEADHAALELVHPQVCAVVHTGVQGAWQHAMMSCLVIKGS